MGKSKALVVGLLLVSGLVSCGGDDGGGDGGSDGNGTANGSTGGNSTGGFPNACELFTEADTADYGGLGEGNRTSNDQVDLCIYTANIGDETRQISIGVYPDVAFDVTVEGLDRVHADSTKSTANLGMESYLWVSERRAQMAILEPPYTLDVSVLLMEGREAAVQDVAETALSRL